MNDPSASYGISAREKPIFNLYGSNSPPPAGVAPGCPEQADFLVIADGAGADSRLPGQAADGIGGFLPSAGGGGNARNSFIAPGRCPCGMHDISLQFLALCWRRGVWPRKAFRHVHRSPVEDSLSCLPVSVNWCFWIDAGEPDRADRQGGKCQAVSAGGLLLAIHPKNIRIGCLEKIDAGQVFI